MWLSCGVGFMLEWYRIYGTPSIDPTQLCKIKYFKNPFNSFEDEILMDKWMVAHNNTVLPSSPQKTNLWCGVPVAERGDVCRQLRGAIIYLSRQGVRHHAKGCMALGW